MRTPTLAAALVLTTSLGLAQGHASAAEPVKVLVVKEHGVGSAAQAQPLLDKFLGFAAKKLGWAAAKGAFVASQGAADGYITSEKPAFGILSLRSMLKLHGPQKLEILGQAEITQPGGREYYVVSKAATDLAGCKGKKLATNHAEDAAFVDRVVAGGAFKLADFDLLSTKRALQGIKMVQSGEAVCALIDDAQLAELTHIEGGKELRSVWKSAKLPPMVVVAFPSAPAAEKKALVAGLGGLCKADGEALCKEIGIAALAPATSQTYAEVLAKYGKAQ
jgi:hypothetical protein